MSFLRNLFEKTQLTNHQKVPLSGSSARVTIDGTSFCIVSNIDALCAAIEVEGRGVLRIPSITYGDVQFALAQRMEKRYGRMSRQYQDVIPSPLVCAGCLWEFPGSYTASLLLPAVFGDVNKVTGATPGFDQFGRSGICPQCGSNESLLVYECFLPDQISEADVYAIRQYWQECALAWWEGQECERTCCRTCRTQLTKKQGYHMGGSHLICEQCVNRVLMTEGLQKLKENPHYYGSALLRKVRRFRT